MITILNKTYAWLFATLTQTCYLTLSKVSLFMNLKKVYRIIGSFSLSFAFFWDTLYLQKYFVTIEY